MSLTRSCTELVQRRAAEEPAFGEALLCEGIDAIDAGTPVTKGQNNHAAMQADRRGAQS